MLSLDFLALQAASEAFLTDAIPDDWEELSSDEQNDWLSENRWVPFENENTNSLYALIDGHADSLREVIKTVLDRLKEKLILAAVESDLPADFNELDLVQLLEKDYAL